MIMGLTSCQSGEDAISEERSAIEGMPMETPAEHGFRLRYPGGKNGEVDYTYEPWHIRYVGPEAARELAAQPGLSLEDYLKNIKN